MSRSRQNGTRTFKHLKILLLNEYYLCVVPAKYTHKRRKQCQKQWRVNNNKKKTFFLCCLL